MLQRRKFFLSEFSLILQAMNGDLRTGQFSRKVTSGMIVNTNLEADILELVVLNRYRPGKQAVAFIRAFGLKQGTLASSVAHDSRHIVAVGCDDESLLSVIDEIIDKKCGIAACYKKILISLKLDISNLMSSASGEEVARDFQSLNHTDSRLDSRLKAPFMMLSFMVLVIISELKLGKKGLFDVNSFDWTYLFVKNV